MHADMVVVQSVGERHVLAPRQGMPGGRDQGHDVAVVGEDVQAVLVVGLRVDANVGRVVRHRAGDARADGFFQVDLYVGMLQQEAAQFHGQELGDRR
ncbi:hypothetical protein D9M68_643650 [compost metagenome]